MTIYNAINNAAARGTRNLILGLDAGNATFDATQCQDNTFVGPSVGTSLTIGFGNCGFGYGSLNSITSGQGNTGYGKSTLISLVTGDYNIAVGTGAGNSYFGAESSNIVIGNIGVTAESNVLRIGQSGSGGAQQNTTYIAGITTQLVTDNTGYRAVLIDPATDKLVSIVSDSMIITDYTTPGSFTWTKNARTKYVKVYGWTGGCGGGSGSKLTYPNSFGGDGGSAGSVFYMEAPAICFGATEPVQVGLGGTGGAAQTVDGSNGNNGTVGGVSYFGSLIPLVNTTGGGGAGVGLSIKGPWIYINQQLWATGGDTSVGAGHPGAGYGRNNAGDNAESAGIGAALGMCPTSGGGGAGIDTIVPILGGTGGYILTMDGLSTLIAGGGSGSRSAGGVGQTGVTSTGAGAVTGGTGGGGGSPGVASSFPGGAGGFPGGGGGGGAGGFATGYNSGAGGAGGGGRILVIEILG